MSRPFCSFDWFGVLISLIVMGYFLYRQAKSEYSESTFYLLMCGFFNVLIFLFTMTGWALFTSILSYNGVLRNLPRETIGAELIYENNEAKCPDSFEMKIGRRNKPYCEKEIPYKWEPNDKN